ncbi:MAG: ABC transporter ATP-binding protein [Actinobacteria bacterium]|nr:ABC transporter ATP-binding protein [Actinomycetota bacterium]MCL5736469.1 ABC transporter ATP-binding protein [Actinomycetota bacterium]
MIAIKNLTKVFVSTKGEQVTALEGLSLDIAPHTFVTVVGPSGCGKTTLLMIVAGLEFYSEGQVLLDGKAVCGPSDDVGIVFQRPVLLPWKTVMENTMLPAMVRGLKDGHYRERAVELLRQVGLEGFIGHYPSELSGGMAQRNAITRALVLDPRLLLMDEPFGALDAITRDRMMLQLTELWESTRKAVLFITHNIQEAVFLADRVIVMSPRPGRIIADVPVDLPRPRDLDVMSHPRFVELTSRIRERLEIGK